MKDFKIGYCINCGEQAYIRSYRGALVAPMPRTKLFYLVLSNEHGHECRVGTLMCCAKCDPMTLNVDDIKETLFKSGNVSGVTGNEPEWEVLPNVRIEIVEEVRGGFSDA